MRSLTSTFAAIALMAATVSGKAHAFDTMADIAIGNMNSGLLLGTGSLITGDDILENSIETLRGDRATRRNLSPAAVAPLRYSPSPAVRADVNRRMVDVLAQAAPEHRAALEQEIGSGRLQTAFAGLMSANDLDSNNLGDVVTAYYLVMWQVAHDHVASPQEVAGARRQLVPNLLSNPGLSSASEREKQEAGESLALLTMLAFASYQDLKSRNDGAGLRQLQESIVQAVRQQGVDLRAVVLTADGFAAR